MFCYKCGYEIPDEAYFCSKCGTSQKCENNIEHKATDIANDNDYNQIAMRIYLQNVQALECIKSKLDRMWNSTNNDIIKAQNDNYNQKIVLEDKKTWWYFDGKDYYINRYCYNRFPGEYNYRYDIASPTFGTWNRQTFNGEWIPIDKNLDFLETPHCWFALCSNSPLRHFEGKKYKKSFFEVYNEFKKIAPANYAENIKKMQPIIDKKEEIYKEWKKTDELLQKAYSINVIPMQFRNIQAVYFLCDFISTSNESFTTALLHCDLDVIKQKLDIVIAQQEEIIINQAVMISQNDQIMQQNQNMLDRLSSMEINASKAAKYAEIAANNAEACAWIGVANYINK